MDTLRGIAKGGIAVPEEEVIEAAEMEDVPDEVEDQEMAAEVSADILEIPEETNALFNAVVSIGEESARRNGAVPVEVLRGEDPTLFASSSSTMRAEERQPEEPLVLLNNWPLDMLTEQEKTFGIIPLLPNGEECLNIYRDTAGLTLKDFFVMEMSDSKLLSVGVAMLWG